MKLSLIGLALLMFGLTTAPVLADPPDEITVCSRNGDLESNSPDIAGLLRTVCDGFAKTLDHRTGEGNSQLLRDLDQFSRDLNAAAKKVDYTDLIPLGMDINGLKHFVNVTTGGKGMEIPVVAFSDAVEKGNKTFRDSGLGFLRFTQHPQAALLEAYWNTVALIPIKKGGTEQDVKALSDLAYPGLPGHIIKLPLPPEELAKVSHNQRYANFELVGDESVRTREQIPLGRSEDPLKGEEWWYTKLQSLRLALTVGVIGLGGYYSGGLSAPAITGVALASGLEAQFTFGSKIWAKVWDKGGLVANIIVNAAYAAIMDSGKSLAEYLSGAPITFNAEDFVIRTAIQTIVTVGTLGGMQVVTARMRRDGTFSEGWRNVIETSCALVANLARAISTVAGMAAGEAVFQIRNTSFNRDQIFGWAISGAIFLSVSAPIIAKRLWGDDARSALIAYRLWYENDPTHPWNTPLIGPIRKACTTALAWFSNLYSPRRTTLSSK